MVVAVKRPCAFCGAPVTGRSDKKYCRELCRNRSYRRGAPVVRLTEWRIRAMILAARKDAVEAKP